MEKKALISPQKIVSRRDFLKVSALFAGAATLGGVNLGGIPETLEGKGRIGGFLRQTADWTFNGTCFKDNEENSSFKNIRRFIRKMKSDQKREKSDHNYEKKEAGLYEGYYNFGRYLEKNSGSISKSLLQVLPIFNADIRRVYPVEAENVKRIEENDYGVLPSDYLPGNMADISDRLGLLHILFANGLVISQNLLDGVATRDILPTLLASMTKVRKVGSQLLNSSQFNDIYLPYNFRGGVYRGFTVNSSNNNDGILLTTFNWNVETILAKAIIEGRGPEDKITDDAKAPDDTRFSLQAMEMDNLTVGELADLYLRSDIPSFMERIQGERQRLKTFSPKPFPENHEVAFFMQLDALSAMVLKGLMPLEEAIYEWKNMTGYDVFGTFGK